MGNVDSQVLVTHVVPRDIARGAQVYASMLRDRLDGPDVSHRIVMLFSGGPGVLRPDVSLDVRAGRLRSAGYDPRVPFRLRQLLAAAPPHVVVTHGSEALLYTVPALPRMSALVHYRIGIGTAAAHRWPRRSVHARALRRASSVAGVSIETLDEAAGAFGVDRDRLRLIPNGRDPGRFRPAPDRTSPAEPVVTFVGHLTASKRPGWLIDAVHALRASGTAVRGRIVGDGPLSGEVTAAAAAFGIEVLGRRDDVEALLADSDVFCFPSRPEGEGLPGVLIEAALSGLPCVTTDVPGARTVVVHGETGFIVAADDQVGFVAAVARLAEDPDLRQRMGDAARRKAAAELTTESSLAKWSQLLQEFADRRSGSDARASREE